jgi:esterase
MKLHYKTLGEGQPLLILHGLFGSADNWMTHAKQWAEEYQVYLIDQRNHGHSEHSDQHTYDLMSEDLFELIASENLRDIILLGHSMGGKTAMKFAQSYSFLIEKLIVVDMGVKAYPPHHQRIFEGLFAVDIAHCPTRQMAEQRLMPFVEEPSTRQFLMKNMYWKSPGELAWRFNLEVLSKQIDGVMVGLEEIQSEVPTCFIRGLQSHYILDQDWPSIQNVFPRSQLKGIEGAGHWVHAEAPTAFIQAVKEFLESRPTFT